MKYPNGQEYKPNSKKERQSHKSKAEISLSSANRGMDLEHEINLSNDYYRDHDICLITTTDYNGVYKSRYIDFEAKNTKNRTSFPLSNITKHQIEHLKRVLFHGGIAFFIINFESLGKIYLLDASYVIEFYEHGERKSIPYDCFVTNGIEIEQGYNPRINYIEAIEKKYF